MGAAEQVALYVPGPSPLAGGLGHRGSSHLERIWVTVTIWLNFIPDEASIIRLAAETMNGAAISRNNYGDDNEDVNDDEDDDGVVDADHCDQPLNSQGRGSVSVEVLAVV